MKKIIFLVSITMLVLTSCGSKSSSAEVKKEVEEEILLNSGSACLFLRPSTEEIKIRFQEGESPFFEHYMLTGHPEDREVTFAFYKAEDVEPLPGRKGEARLKPGKKACRLYIIQLPYGEIAKEWGAGQLVTIRKDGSKHIMKYILVDQPPVD